MTFHSTWCPVSFKSFHIPKEKLVQKDIILPVIHDIRHLEQYNTETRADSVSYFWVVLWHPCLHLNVLLHNEIEADKMTANPSDTRGRESPLSPPQDHQMEVCSLLPWRSRVSKAKQTPNLSSGEAVICHSRTWLKD